MPKRPGTVNATSEIAPCLRIVSSELHIGLTGCDEGPYAAQLVSATRNFLQVMITFAEMLERLRNRLPNPPRYAMESREVGAVDGVPEAAVTLILRERDEVAEMLVIQRAENPHDYWSGHLALPGGRRDQRDSSLMEAAAREVDEEVGIALSLQRDFLGQLTPLSPSSSRLPLIRVTPFVAVVSQPVRLRLSPEVGSAFWTSVEELRRSGLSASKSLEIGDRIHTWPAYPSVKGPIWGLTQRIISEFLTYLD